MDISNKNGRTFWDLISENKIWFFLFFVAILGVGIWLVKTGITVKTPGLELLPKQDTIFNEEPMASSLKVESYKQMEQLFPSTKKSIHKGNSNISDNTFGDNAKVESSPTNIENNGINYGIMAKEVEVNFETLAVEEYVPEMTFMKDQTQIFTIDNIVHTTLLFGSPNGAPLSNPTVRMRFDSKVDSVTGGVVGSGIVLAGNLKKSMDNDGRGYLISTDFLHPSNCFQVTILSKQPLKLTELEMKPQKP